MPAGDSESIKSLHIVQQECDWLFSLKDTWWEVMEVLSQSRDTWWWHIRRKNCHGAWWLSHHHHYHNRGIRGALYIYIYIYGTSIHSRTRVLQSPVPWNKDGIWSLQYGLPGKPDNWVWEEWNRIPSEAPGWGRVDHWWESWIPWSLPQVHHQWLGEQDHSVDPDKGTKRNVEAGTEDQRLHGI